MSSGLLCFNIALRTVPLFAMKTWMLPTYVVLLTLLLPAVIGGLWLAVRYIPHNSVGIVEKLWSLHGSVTHGDIIALRGEAGYQADVLRGGLYFGIWRWQYRVHTCALVAVPQGMIGYVYARDGEPMTPSQTLARNVPCNNFQDAREFLAPPGTDRPRGQRGRQRAILREGVYAINTALFVVITESRVFAVEQLMNKQELSTLQSWHNELAARDGFRPVVIGQQQMGDKSSRSSEEADDIGIVTIHDGPSLDPGELIAPAVGAQPDDSHYHNNFQDPEAFLAAGGRRGRQHQPLTDGTYFINRWFATVETIPKTVVPIGFVGVVVSYYGRAGQDRSGIAFRHGERVGEGERGVWERPLGPGKYSFNTYAGNIVRVPTTNFVLHWITGRTETHRYDESLRSIDLVTRDAYEPSLPLSVVVHIDYLRAPSVIQRFGNVERLITQTLDPLLSSYFRDIAHRKTMLELLQDRDVIQNEARGELRRRFHEFDIECVDVLIGKPTTGQEGGKIEELLEQLRLRQLSIEKLETYEKQRIAAEQLLLLNEAQANAQMQTALSNARVQAQIVESQAEADLKRARKQAEQAIVNADMELQRARRQSEQMVMLAEAEKQRQILAGQGEGERTMQAGMAAAKVFAQRVAAYGDPRLYALTHVSQRLSSSRQPLVPERIIVTGGNGSDGQTPTSGLMNLLFTMLMTDKAGFNNETAPTPTAPPATLNPPVATAQEQSPTA